MFAEELIQDDECIEAERLDWSLAACRAVGESMTELFFSESIEDIARAKSICRECVLIRPCFEGAAVRREPWGVWGGQLFFNGKVLAQKRKRGRPPKVRPLEVGVESATLTPVMQSA